MNCPHYGNELIDHGTCQVTGCKNRAKFEGYTERKDFSGNSVGSIFLARVCDEHKVVLIGGQR